MCLKYNYRQDNYMGNKNSYYGSENSNWKGSNKNVSERALHYRITAKRGKASDHMCARCHKQRAAEWARQKDGSYKPFCRHCHHVYDAMIKNTN